MFNIGELIIYSGHGICKIDEICENTISGITKKYYVLHPLESAELKISTPVDNDKVKMLEIIHKDEAEEILESFKQTGVTWVELTSHREQLYSEIVKEGNRREIAKVVNTLLRKKLKTEAKGKKLYEQDRRLLEFIQRILFSELAMSLNTTYKEIYDKIIVNITISQQ
ncbi:CarD family transcriptional regulator [Clostridium punense]|uniref:CarD family transcriptional regulator n=1 Tax=Clostridium punense TaxID=1054297 RepID=A0ABS4K8L7_9CLOT|nr:MULTISPECIES: CarD family transcriptional regulator [Clostridium]EQB87229.1 hypothetical protein M918_10260 [Clostridium sp. BL8]MBP2023685.1 CarD family transcriptional regulator [Clostridium punense]